MPNGRRGRASSHGTPSTAGATSGARTRPSGRKSPTPPTASPSPSPATPPPGWSPWHASCCRS